MTTTDVEIRPKTVICPACKRRVSVTKGLNLHRHGDGFAGPCRGWIAVVAYRYEVVESDVEKVPVGSFLIYREYRGPESQQDMLIDGEPAGGWYMEFDSVGVKYDRHWYRLDGSTEWTGSAVGGQEVRSDGDT